MEIMKKHTLADLARYVDEFLTVWDNHEGEFNEEDFAVFKESLENATAQLADKVDNWIDMFSYFDSVLAMAKAKRDRYRQVIKGIERMIEWKRSYVKSVAIANEGVKLKGDYGTISLRNNEKVELKFSTHTKSFSNIVPEGVLELDASIIPFCKQVTFYQLDMDLVNMEAYTDTPPSWTHIVKDKSIVIPKLKNKGDELERY